MYKIKVKLSVKTGKINIFGEIKVCILKYVFFQSSNSKVSPATKLTLITTSVKFALIHWLLDNSPKSAEASNFPSGDHLTALTLL